ncbi:Ohr subfamily peroxiredoxin [Cohnella lupini]|uniref:Ohr subfamily peroxiredoxin n=2 Tax=Cohnella lupini TaxID=1294267 RepID=A0A3D9HYC3_9BACL|nr:Ohr subfamily peroxiredoxin [Cohnella lupini]
MGNMEKKLYTGIATVEGGRDGKAVSSDGVLNLDLKVPKELGGAGGHGTNPEQLFAAGYAACFDGALNVAIRMKKIKVEGTKVTANVTIGKDANDAFMLTAKLDVSVSGVDADVAEQLVADAHQICPYSRLTREGMAVELNVVD